MNIKIDRKANISRFSEMCTINSIKKNIDWLISSMQDILKDSKNQFIQKK